MSNIRYCMYDFTDRQGERRIVFYYPDFDKISDAGVPIKGSL